MKSGCEFTEYGAAGSSLAVWLDESLKLIAVTESARYELSQRHLDEYLERPNRWKEFELEMRGVCVSGSLTITPVCDIFIAMNT
jgi:hypothetical protein